MANPQFCREACTIRKYATDDFGQGHWDNNDSEDYREKGNLEGASDDGDENNCIIEEQDDDDE